MNNKYIIKNCPALYGIDDGFLCSDNNDEDEKYCIDCTDCVIKRVIEKCKGAVYDYSNFETPRTACEVNLAYGKATMADEILQLFDIEEIKK